MGTDQWNKISNKAKEKAHDVAAELLELYAFRSIETGKMQSSDTEEYQSFVSDFEYVLTRDQAKTIEEVMNDLSSDKKMDRLICGDVGFGKTEVALRTAFVAVQSGKQVAIVTPTTFQGMMCNLPPEPGNNIVEFANHGTDTGCFNLR